MPDREKVIKGLEICIHAMPDCDQCPYNDECKDGLFRDALETLESLQGAIDQARWERDVAINQLKEIGKGLGEKMDDIVELLKEQEPVKPVVLIDTWACGKCKAKLERQALIGPNMLINENFNYCPACGRKVQTQNTKNTESFWDSMSERDLFEPMKHFRDMND